MRTTPNPFLTADRRALLGAPRCETCGSGAVTRRTGRRGEPVFVCSTCGRGNDRLPSIPARHRRRRRAG